jgi:hypothetical protein
MQFAKGKPPETQNATRPGARAKRRELALGRPGFKPGHIRTWLSLTPSQGLLLDLWSMMHTPCIIGIFTCGSPVGPVSRDATSSVLPVHTAECVTASCAQDRAPAAAWARG